MKCTLTQMEAQIAHPRGIFLASKIIITVLLECRLGIKMHTFTFTFHDLTP